MYGTLDIGYHDIKLRTEEETAALIIRAAKKPRMTKTRIMYEVFLSDRQIEEYLSVLIEKGLLEYQKGTMFYRTTEKGCCLL
jgi:predicted transcriptional regulator